jgi:hypothetical protein
VYPHEYTSDENVRLRYYLENATHDPFFAIPESNLHVMHEALVDINDKNDQLLTQASAETRTFLKKILYQTSFLSSLIETEQARRNFIIEPTFENAYEYHASIKHSFEEYVKTSNAFLSAIDEIPIGEYGYLGGTTDSGFVREAVFEAQTSARARMMEEDIRFTCLERGIGCSSKKRVFPLYFTYDESSPAMPSLSRYFIDAAQRFIDPGMDTPYPLAIIPKSTCSPRATPAVYAFGIKQKYLTKVDPAEFLNVRDFYFNDLANETSQNTYAHFLYTQGLEYSFQPLNAYLCIDYFQESSEIYSAYAVKDRIVKKPLISSVTVNSSLPGIKDAVLLENSIIRNESLDINTIERLISIYQKILTSTDDEELKKIFPSDIVEDMHSIVLAWKSKSFWLEHQLAAIAARTVSFEPIIRRELPKVQHVVLNRSYFTIFLQMYNQTISRPPGSLIRTHGLTDLKKLGLVSYTQSLSRAFPPTMLYDVITNLRARELESWEAH